MIWKFPWGTCWSMRGIFPTWGCLRTWRDSETSWPPSHTQLKWVCPVPILAWSGVHSTPSPALLSSRWWLLVTMTSPSTQTPTSHYGNALATPRSSIAMLWDHSSPWQQGWRTWRILGLSSMAFLFGGLPGKPRPLISHLIWGSPW